MSAIENYFDSRGGAVRVAQEQAVLIIQREAELAAARARIAELEASLTWRPIAEAPKDGGWLMLRFGDCWVKGKWNERKGLSYWVDEDGGWEDDQGEPLQPTHFLPAPEPPRERGQ